MFNMLGVVRYKSFSRPKKQPLKKKCDLKKVKIRELGFREFKI